MFTLRQHNLDGVIQSCDFFPLLKLDFSLSPASETKKKIDRKMKKKTFPVILLKKNAKFFDNVNRKFDTHEKKLMFPAAFLRTDIQHVFA